MTIRTPETSRMFATALLSGAMVFAIQSVGCVDIGGPTGCQTQEDCRDGRLCIENQCVTFEIYDDPENNASNNSANNQTTGNTTPINTTPGNRTTPIQVLCEDTRQGCSDCMELSPEPLDFGLVPVGERRVEQINIRNCDDERSLGVYGFGLEVEGDFEISAWSVSEPPFQLAPGDEAFINITLEPTYEGDHYGVLAIESSATGEAFAEVFGIALAVPDDNVCPTARATAFAPETGRPPEKTLDNVPPGLILLDGSQSTDRDGAISRWQWGLERRPDGSSASLEFSEGPEAEIFVDAPGRYELLLRVYDDFGVESCEPAQVFINVCDDCEKEP